MSRTTSSLRTCAGRSSKRSLARSSRSSTAPAAPHLWPIKFPKEGERDNEAWISARAAAKAGMERWVKIVWVKRTYLTRDAEAGYAPDPDFSKLPSFNELVRLAFGDHGVVRDKSHAVYRELYGIKPEAAKRDTGDDL